MYQLVILARTSLFLELSLLPMKAEILLHVFNQLQYFLLKLTVLFVLLHLWVTAAILLILMIQDGLPLMVLKLQLTNLCVTCLWVSGTKNYKIVEKASRLSVHGQFLTGV